MNDAELKLCCEPLHEYANEHVQKNGVIMKMLDLIREQVIMACTQLAEDYTVENQKVAMSESELNFMREFYNSEWADEYLEGFDKCKTGDEVVVKFLSDVPRMLGDYDFGDAQRVGNIISEVTSRMLSYIKRQYSCSGIDANNLN